ncbi:porin [Oxalobacteraceae bacterium CAVE-383]|nr:porin [Oxalobacteraceae bacterium CAVE-383]
MIGSVQAQTNVTAYGVVDQYLDFSKAGANSASRVQSGGLDGSRLGFRGEEALGAGLKAVFQIEAGFNADDGTSGQGGVLFGRQSYVGLGGNFGQVTLGRQYSMYYDTLVNYGLGGGLAWGNASEYFDDGAILRVNNSVKYESPDFSGFTFKGLYGMGENSAPGMRSVGNLSSVGGQYANGPVSLGLSYSTRKTQISNNERWAAFGISYNFGPIKPAFLITDRRDDSGFSRSSIYEVSAEIPLTNSSLLLDVGRIRDRAFPNANATAYSMRYDYNVSKRTTLYTGLAYIKADRNAFYGINGSTGAGLLGAPGDNSHALIAGIRHRF